jgi:cysteine desulfurase
VSPDSGDAAVVPRVHLDTASGLPLHPRAREAWLEAQDAGWADPVRAHREGRAARFVLEAARESIASLLGCAARELSFTSSGAAACHLGVLGLRRGRARAGTTVVHAAVEHPAVLRAAGWSLAGPRPDIAMPAATVSVGVDAYGSIDLPAWRAAVTAPSVAVACLQSANHEVGTVQPLPAAAAACREGGVPLFVDAAASIGWADPPTGDVVAASAHKWGGPPGVGLLIVRDGVSWRSPWPPDDREQASAGYVDVASVHAAAAALEAVEAERRVRADGMRRMTAELRRELLATVAEVDVVGHPDRRLPHIVDFSCMHVDGDRLVQELDRAGFAVSGGSAAGGGSTEPSHVLAAMGAIATGNIRVSISPETTPEDLWRFVDAIASIVPRLRADAGVSVAGSAAAVDRGRHRASSD